MSERSTLDEEIAAIAAHDILPWRRVGRLLRAVEADELWRGSAANFTRYLEDLAQKFGVTPNVLWRAYGAVHTWTALTAALASRGAPAPALDELPTSVTPETVELLEKIQRVARPEDWEAVARDVLAGKLGRIALRARWSAFKAALKGRTARGRGVDRPVIKRGEKDLLASDLAASFVAAFPRCFGYETVSRRSLFTDVPVGDPFSPAKYELDFIGVLVHPDGGVELHGVKISSWSLPQQRPATFAEATHRYVDVLWLASPADVDALSELLEVSGPGILLFDSDGWRIAARPLRRPGDGEWAGETAKALLARRRQL